MTLLVRALEVLGAALWAKGVSLGLGSLALCCRCLGLCARLLVLKGVVRSTEQRAELAPKTVAAATKVPLRRSGHGLDLFEHLATGGIAPAPYSHSLCILRRRVPGLS